MSNERNAASAPPALRSEPVAAPPAREMLVKRLRKAAHYNSWRGLRDGDENSETTWRELNELAKLMAEAADALSGVGVPASETGTPEE